MTIALYSKSSDISNTLAVRSSFGFVWIVGDGGRVFEIVFVGNIWLAEPAPTVFSHL
ncbi:MAG: hypothetical protein HC786_13230 [Richelia sp. CSU_2_1]|nr:hypothetical protein [Microcoleus sp. SU_5_6]NJL68766.1 hypothetical protein [Microcoleus sp. SM1_3_4]NJR23047.1 hypothetical protein [Richelia sp. CSU_2_1]